MVLAGSQLNHRGMTMRSKKRVLVTAFGATVALTLQTPVSAFIVSFSQGGGRHGGCPPQSALLPRRRLQRRRPARPGGRPLERMAGGSCRLGRGRPRQRAGAAGAGRLDAGRPRSGLPRRRNGRQGRNGSIAPASGDSPTANASVIGGSGSGGGGGAGGIGGAGGGGGGAGAGGVDAAGGADGLGAGEASGSLLASAAGNAGSNGLVAGEFGTLPGVSAGRLNSPFPAVPAVLVITDPASGGPVPTPLAVESPEPGTLLFLGAGLAGLAARRARRNRSGRGQPAIR